MILFQAETTMFFSRKPRASGDDPTAAKYLTDDPK